MTLRIFTYLTLVTLLSCNKTTSKETVVNEIKPKTPECGCTWADVDRFIRSTVYDYNLEQNNVYSLHAKRLTINHVPDFPRPDCSYVVRIKTEDLNAGLGLSEPKYIEKRVKCDGTEVYID